MIKVLNGDLVGDSKPLNSLRMFDNMVCTLMMQSLRGKNHTQVISTHHTPNGMQYAAATTQRMACWQSYMPCQSSRHVQRAAHTVSNPATATITTTTQLSRQQPVAINLSCQSIESIELTWQTSWRSGWCLTCPGPITATKATCLQSNMQ